jgi:hypothetical protein
VSVRIRKWKWAAVLRKHVGLVRVLDIFVMDSDLQTRLTLLFGLNPYNDARTRKTMNVNKAN